MLVLLPLRVSPFFCPFYYYFYIASQRSSLFSLLPLVIYYRHYYYYGLQQRRCCTSTALQKKEGYFTFQLHCCSYLFQHCRRCRCRCWCCLAACSTSIRFVDASELPSLAFPPLWASLFFICYFCALCVCAAPKRFKFKNVISHKLPIKLCVQKERESENVLTTNKRPDNYCKKNFVHQEKITIIDNESKREVQQLKQQKWLHLDYDRELMLILFAAQTTLFLLFSTLGW